MPHEKRKYHEVQAQFEKAVETDWRPFDAMSERRRQRAALSDPDCPPATAAQLARTRRVPTVRALRKS